MSICVEGGGGGLTVEEIDDARCAGAQKASIDRLMTRLVVT